MGLPQSKFVTYSFPLWTSQTKVQKPYNVLSWWHFPLKRMFILSSIKILRTFQSPVLMLPSVWSLSTTPSQSSHPPYLFPLEDSVPQLSTCILTAYTCFLCPTQHSDCSVLAVLKVLESHSTCSEDIKGKFVRVKQANWGGTTFCRGSGRVGGLDEFPAHCAK